MFTHRTILAATALCAVAGATAIGSATAADGDAAITVGATTVVKQAGDKAPFDAAGVKAIRRGRAIPKGYVLVGRTVTVDRGTAGSVGAAVKLRCPNGKTARTLGVTGENGPNLIGSTPYPGHKEVRVAVWSPPRHPKSTGTSWLVCR